MKRIALIAIAAAVVLASTDVTAMVPEQVKIDSGLLKDRERPAHRARVQGHSVCGAAARREPLEGAAAGREVGGRAQGGRIWRSVRRRSCRRWPWWRPWAAPGAAAQAQPHQQRRPRRRVSRRAPRTASISTSGRARTAQRSPARDGVDLRRRFHRRLRRSGLV